MTILWEKDTPEEIDFDYEETIAQVMAQAAKQENCPYEFEVNLTMTDNEGIRELNREFRQLDDFSLYSGRTLVRFPWSKDYRQNTSR